MKCGQCGKEGAIKFQRQDRKLLICKDLGCIDVEQREYYEVVEK